MSRSGYSDDCDNWSLICWRGAVNRAIKGKRGQVFLKELAITMDAMPQKRLVRGELQDGTGEVCTLGVVGRARGIDMFKVDVEDRKAVAELFGVAEALAAEIEYENDDGWFCTRESPEERWRRMRKWVAEKIIPDPLPLPNPVVE